MPASSAGGGHPPGLVAPSMGKALRGGDEEQEHNNEGLEDNNEAHEIADRCISEMSESLWMLSPLWTTESLTASSSVIAFSSAILDL